MATDRPRAMTFDMTFDMTIDMTIDRRRAQFRVQCISVTAGLSRVDSMVTDVDQTKWSALVS